MRMSELVVRRVEGELTGAWREFTGNGGKYGKVGLRIQPIGR
jgi:hypothetical protein